MLAPMSQKSPRIQQLALLEGLMLARMEQCEAEGRVALTSVNRVNMRVRYKALRRELSRGY